MTTGYESVTEYLESLMGDDHIYNLYGFLEGDTDAAQMDYEDFAGPMKLSGGQICMHVPYEDPLLDEWYKFTPAGMVMIEGESVRHTGPDAVIALKSCLEERFVSVEPVMIDETPFKEGDDE